MANDTVSPAVPAAAAHLPGSESSTRLGWFLCWAVVFADIGTSIYYVPGILYAQAGIGRLAGLFVLLTLLAFLLLTLKYAEVSVRFPEGGGVVTVSARGLSPWAGAVGGMFILVDYFLNAAISSLSGIQYFSTLVPSINHTGTLVIITLIVLVLLGILNWYGIKESAAFSAAFAIAAFLSDIVIIVMIFIRVPPRVIGLVLEQVFATRHLAGATILTGFAGAFLAFSGLESISQLSPVMRLPRSKTVSRALALVAITVGVTSPLLTIFSTVLLTTNIDPAHVNPANADPSQFISQLGGAYGGPVLAIATAVTASALLVFASNTAIIGAYHVFLALSRMRFFPDIVERTDPRRGTPIVSIILATGIPMVVLIAVRGDINTLGDMYAFGLLGAFSLTCLSLDVIRMRERRNPGMAFHPDDVDEHDAHEIQRQVASAQPGRLAPAIERIQAGWRLRLGEQNVARAQQWNARATALRVNGWQRTASTRAAFGGLWPDIKFYLGLLTTALVCVAWVTNLINKPLATEFGGGLTVLGVGIAVAHYRYQSRGGAKPVFPLRRLHPMPGSVLVTLLANEEHNKAVIQAAISSAHGRLLVFLYLAQRPGIEPEFMQIADPYFFDKDAQRIFSTADALAGRAGLHADFIYRIGNASQIADAWKKIRSEEILMEAKVAKALSKLVAPEYVRFQVLDDTRVAHYVVHGATGVDDRAPATPTNRSVTPKLNGNGATPANNTPAPPVTEQPQNVPPLTGDELPAATDDDRWVWTGVDLVEREGYNGNEKNNENGHNNGNQN